MAEEELTVDLEPEPEPEPVPPRPRRKAPKKKRPVSEAQREAARRNIAKAQAARGGKAAPKAMTPAALRSSHRDTLKSASGALSVAGVIASPRLVYDAEIIAAKADELAAELVAVAEKSPPLYAALVTLVKGSAWAKLGGLAVSIALPIMANHGLLPTETAMVVGAPLPPPREPKVDVSANGANGSAG